MILTADQRGILIGALEIAAVEYQERASRFSPDPRMDQLRTKLAELAAEAAALQSQIIAAPSVIVGEVTETDGAAPRTRRRSAKRAADIV